MKLLLRRLRGGAGSVCACVVMAEVELLELCTKSEVVNFLSLKDPFIGAAF